MGGIINKKHNFQFPVEFQESVQNEPALSLKQDHYKSIIKL